MVYLLIISLLLNAILLLPAAVMAYERWLFRDF